MHRRLGGFGFGWRGFGARGNFTFRAGDFSMVATVHRKTRQGWTLSVCVFHADFWRATLHVRGLHRHTDPVLDARALVLNVFYRKRIYRRRDSDHEQNTSATGSCAVRPNVSFVDGSAACSTGVCSYPQQRRIDQPVRRIGDERWFFYCRGSGIKNKVRVARN